MRRILHGPVGRTPRHVIRNFRAKYRSSDLPVFNIKQNLAKKLDPTLKSSHLNEGVTYLTSFLHTKAQISTPFLRDKTLKSCTRVLHAYPEASPAGFRFVFIFFSPKKKWAERWSTFSEKSYVTKNQATKTKTKLLVRSSQGHIEDVCKKFSV